MKSLFIFLFFSLICSILSAQEKYIEGIVTTFDSIAVVGAEIEVKSSNQNIKTDTLGFFKVKVDIEKDKLKIKAKGFITQNVKVKKNTKNLEIDLKLKPTEKAKEYAIGYGYVKDSDKLNALVKLSNKDTDFSQYSDILELIRGRFPGVQVEGNDIIIRGQSSLTQSSAALIIVDGTPCDSNLLKTIVPASVKSINILKDGGAAIYGSRGANGVVIIEIKKGEE